MTLALFPSQRQGQNADLDWIRPSLVSNRLLNNLERSLLHVGKMRRCCLAMCLCYLSYFSANFWSVDVVLLELCKKTKKKIHYIFLAVQDATLYSEDKIDKKILSTGR